MFCLCLTSINTKSTTDNTLNSKTTVIKATAIKNNDDTSEAIETVLVIKNRIIQLITATKTDKRSGGYTRHKPIIAPILVDTPLPPLKFKNIGQLWPHTDKSAEKI